MALAICLGLSAAAFALPFGVPAAVRAADDAASVIARYQQRIPELMAEQNVPGLAIALVDG